MVTERDFIGYGSNPPQVEWPNGARIAVSVVVNYEEGAEYSILDGDSQSESMGEVPSPVTPGERDLANESFYEYGSRAGVWRILRIFDQFNLKSTFYVCALALERNPEVGPAIVEGGHEVMGHGYRWEEYFNMDRDAEREAIRKAVASITRTTGQRPLGWYTATVPASTPETWSWRRADSCTTATRTQTICPSTPASMASRGWSCHIRWR